MPQGGVFGEPSDIDRDAQPTVSAAVDTCNSVHSAGAGVAQPGRSTLHRSVALDALQRALARNCTGCTAILALHMPSSQSVPLCGGAAHL